MVCLDEMGPQAAKSFPGQRLVTPAAPKAERAKQEIDYGRRGSGYVFGAFQPASGAALTRPTELGLPFACWTLDRLVAYLSNHGIAMRRSRISDP